jgi:hypothetical protein
VHFPRLDERIRELCAKAVTAPETELEAILRELNSALREHTMQLRKLAATKLVGGDNQPESS